MRVRRTCPSTRHTRCHTREDVIMTSPTAAATSQIMTTTLNFRKSVNLGTIPIATDDAIPPTGVCVRSIVYENEEVALTSIREGTYNDSEDDKYIGGQDLDPPSEEKLNERRDDTLKGVSFMNTSCRQTTYSHCWVYQPTSSLVLT